MPQTAEGTTADDTLQNPGRVPHLPRRASASKAHLRPRGRAAGRGGRACASGPQVHQYIPVRRRARRSPAVVVPPALVVPPVAPLVPPSLASMLGIVVRAQASPVNPSATLIANHRHLSPPHSVAATAPTKIDRRVSLTTGLQASPRATCPEAATPRRVGFAVGSRTEA